MTYKEVYESCLTELNKVQAPSLLIKDFVYLFNKAIQLYVNKKYNTFEMGQLSTDDLRVLANSIRIDSTNGLSLHSDTGETHTFEDSYDCLLPKDYVHILNVVCEFKNNNPQGRCPSNSLYIRQGANKLDTNQWSSVISNYYMRPSVKRPYYYIINIKGNSDPDASQTYKKEAEKAAGTRYGNSTVPIMLIKYGNDSATYTLEAVYIDYLRAPQYFKIEQSDLDDIEDNTKLLEFPDYVVYEVINEIVNLVMENASDPRIQTHPAVTTTIAPLK